MLEDQSCILNACGAVAIVVSIRTLDLLQEYAMLIVTGKLPLVHERPIWLFARYGAL